MEISIPGVTIKSANELQTRMTMLLWGAAGCGKTTLAASAPGNKLLINFDPDGQMSLGAREDVLVMDLSREKYSVVEKFKSDDPYNLSKVLADDSNGIETVIIDSLTSYSQYAVEQGIANTKGATLERPSPGAYGARNALTLRLVAGMLRLTGKHNKNCIFITHEDGPTTDDSGNVLYITMMLGGKLPDQAALQLSEVWYMSDNGKERKILARNGRMRKPMKSRMLDTTKEIEFTLKYDQNNPHEGGIAEWIEMYRLNNQQKIPLPYSPSYQTLKEKLFTN